MKTLFVTFLTLSGFFLFEKIKATEKADSVIVIEGYVVEKKTFRPIERAHVFSETLRVGTLTDSTGRFKLMLLKKDVLIITRMGFQPYMRSFNVKAGDADKIVYELKEEIYEIPEVIIFAHKNYEQFKKAVINYQPPVTRIDEATERLKQACKEAAREAVPVSLNPSIKLAVFDSKYNRDMAKYKKVLAKEKKRKALMDKIDYSAVSKMTGLKGERLNELVSECIKKYNFTPEWKEYDILEAIFNYYKNQSNDKIPA